jgi:hypothetical protein
VIIGIVALGLITPNAEVASPFLLRFIDCSKDRKCEGHGDSLEPIHRTSRINQEKRLNLSAFEKNSVGGIGYFTIPKPNKPIPMRSALYVLASGHPPEWYQFDWVLPVNGHSTLTISSLTRTYTERPMVAWNREWPHH